MKNLKVLSILIILPVIMMSQTPQAFNYQATVRNSVGDILTMTDVEFDIELIQNGETVYSEQHTGLNTGKIGVVNLKIGAGNSSNDFESIDWSQGNIKMKVSFSIEGGDEQIMPETELVAVPFALFAQNSGDSHWTKADTSLFHLDSDVGVGVSEPTAKFHIVHVNEDATSVSGGSTFIIGPTNMSGQAHLRMGVDETYSWIQSHGGRPLSINPVGNNIGIGTTSPEEKLQVTTGPAGGIKIEGNTSNSSSAMAAFLNLESNIDFRGRGLFLTHRDASDTDNNSWFVGVPYQGAGFQIGNSNNHEVTTANSAAYKANSLFHIKEDGDVGIGTNNPQDKLHVEGTTRTCVLRITGGCDIKEDLNSIELLEPGDVVVIDEDNPGNIKRTSKPYDQKVLGVISGANGINPGISLSQDDVLEGDYPLTMLGRVYVKVTGKVEVGDMITTSAKTGYAKAVKRKSKAYGAVIGKAMTANEKGEGHILVFINLQ